MQSWIFRSLLQCHIQYHETFLLINVENSAAQYFYENRDTHNHSKVWDMYDLKN